MMKRQRELDLSEENPFTPYVFASHSRVEKLLKDLNVRYAFITNGTNIKALYVNWHGEPMLYYCIDKQWNVMYPGNEYNVEEYRVTRDYEGDIDAFVGEVDDGDMVYTPNHVFYGYDDGIYRYLR